jgi:hypothetical protein
LKKHTEKPVLFLDESNHGPSISQPLRDSGCEVVCINEVFGSGVKDEIWIPYVADKGWAIITKDRAQQVSTIELMLLYMHSAKRYLISGQNLKGSDIADRIISNYKKIENTFNSQPAPFIYSIRKDGLSLSFSAKKMKARLKKMGGI